MSGFHVITLFFHQTVKAYRCVQNQFNLSVGPPPHTEGERLYGYFQQNGTAHTTFTFSRVREVFGEERTINRSGKILWPPRSPDHSPCDFQMWDELKDQVYSNDPHTPVELHQNIENAISSRNQ
ncbi:hypothetical protein NPIL_589991 [Nephila pilipes]|uniref:Uncharacterized protein n=1 Tax=Nephila pilipes TaxID=299642 RepID=A0A8X6UB36_NEPPI|nr:hypothetical protein NPIL_589991 [Nephila pilipes]